MGAPEEVGKVASSAIDALKTNPSCLAAILLAALFAGLTYLSLTAERRESHERALAMTERCFPIALMHAIRDEALQEFRKDERKLP